MERQATVLMLGALLGFGCVSRPKFDDSFVEQRSGQVHMLAGASDLILIGTVVSVGPAPLAWSGKLRATQAVAIQVDRVLKGFASEPVVTVYEPVVANSHIGGPGPLPSLSTALFKSGSRVIVLVSKGVPPEMFDGVDADVGVIPGTRANENAIEHALGIL